MSATVPNKLTTIRLGDPRPPWRLSPIEAQAWAEAAAVCLHDCGHCSGVEMTVTGFSDVNRVLVEAPEVSEQMLATHRNLKPAAERGAVAVVASLIHELTDELFLEQSVDYSGIDYWLGRRNEGPLFQNKTRIEISGILREASNNKVESRIRDKRERLRKYDDESPAKIVVVEFSAPKAVMVDHD